MSSVMVPTAAAQGRFFFFGDTTVSKVSSPLNKLGMQIHKEVLSEAHEPEPLRLADFSGNLAAAPDFRINHPKFTDSKFIDPKFTDPKFTNPRLAGITAASRLGVRPSPEMLPSGIAAINALTGGWPRGCLTEICGAASSGRTTVMLAALAAATRRGEFCVLVDAGDALDPRSAADAGVELDRLLWVRCGENSSSISSKSHSSKSRSTKSCSPRKFRDEDKNFSPANQNPEVPEEDRVESRNQKRHAEHRLEQVLRATDLLLESGGFGLVVLDLSDLPPLQARRIPLTTWFRYRRAIEHKPTVLLAVAQHPIAGSCSSLLLELASQGHNKICQTGHTGQPVFDFLFPSHAQLLTGLDITAELICSRMERKPARSIAFVSKTAWVEQKPTG